MTAEQQAMDFNPELLDVGRKRKLAELLMVQGMQQPQGQMISGYYVAPSFAQQLNPMANILAGQAIGNRADKSQLDYANALRGKKLEVQKAIEQKINTGDLKGALAIASQNGEYGGKDFIAPLLGNVIPKAPDVMSDKDREDIRIKDAQIAAQIKNYERMAAQQNQSLAQSRVPMGYRFTPDGKGLEAIPGGPADQKAQNIDTGRQTVSTLIDTLKSKYDLLKDSGGIVSTNSGALSNAPSALASSDFGQSLGKTFGTQNQSARNTIAQSKPILLQAISKALGVSSKQLDSNRELQLYLDAVSNPKLDYETNIGILSQLAELYGTNGSASPIANTAGGASNVPSASDIDAEIARRRKK